MRQIATIYGGMWIIAVCLAGAAAGQDVTLFAEDFDSDVLPGLPAGWTGDAVWTTSDAVASTGSGSANLQAKGTAPGNVTTPTLDLSIMQEGAVAFLARRTSSYAAESLRVTASVDGGATFPVTLAAEGAALPAGDGRYERIEVPVPAELLGAEDVVLRFEALGGSTGSANIRIDDVTVAGTVNGVYVAPSALSLAAEVGGTQRKTVTATNHSAESVTLDPPDVSGAPFSVEPTATVLLAPGEEQVYEVTYAPGTEGPHSGSLVLTHTLGAKTVALSGATIRNVFEFSMNETIVLEGTAAVQIPLRLKFEGEAGLQSIQFDVAWDDSAVSLLALERGAAIEDESAWTLSHEAATDRVRIIVLSDGADGLPAGDYDPVLTLHFETAALIGPGAVTFVLQDVLGALATPTGDDAGLTTGVSTYTVTVQSSTAVFGVSPGELVLGTLEVGEEGAADVVATNTGGTRDLTVTGVDVDNTLFSVEPAAAVIPPEESRTFTVTFAPTESRFGYQSGMLTFVHDGTEETGAQVAVQAIGVYGRGDTDGDGLVDVIDLVQVLDAILERTALDDRQMSLADLHPFGEGDGRLDVRDLTVVAQGIARGRWPDEAVLPAAAPEEPTAAARWAGAKDAPIQAHLEPGADGVTVVLEHDQPVRAFQLALYAEGSAAVSSVPVEGSTVMTDAGEGVVRLLLFRSDGGTIPAGRYPLARITRQHREASLELQYAAAVGERGERLDVALRRGQAGAEAPLPDEFALGMPYPNPYRLSGHLSVKVALDLPGEAEVHMGVYDVLGRQVIRLPAEARPAGRTLLAWTGRDGGGRLVRPGLYVIQIAAGPDTASRSVLVVP